MYTSLISLQKHVEVSTPMTFQTGSYDMNLGCETWRKGYSSPEQRHKLWLYLFSSSKLGKVQPVTHSYLNGVNLCVSEASHDLTINPPIPRKSQSLLGNISKRTS